MLVGLQGSGKTTFRVRCLPAGYTVVSKDLFPRSARHRQRRQMRLVEEALERGRPVVVDNTNPSPPDVPNALARNAARRGRERVPEAGFFDTLRRLREPRRSDGFDAVREVRIDGRGGFDVRDVPHVPRVRPGE
ncbi:AAA domain-containing protein [Streptomyces pini]|uniref:AAA domain-containing protein n=1 Tax=Streptomyces pini TaxID=1520580 RepID=A0A1I3XFW6_9ACTN|nr:AAA domain-containing protein [Streptomyces pini]